MDGWTDERIDGWMDGDIHIPFCRGVREGGTGGSMDPPVDVPATPTRYIFGQFSRGHFGKKKRSWGAGNYEKKKAEKKKNEKS